MRATRRRLDSWLAQNSTPAWVLSIGLGGAIAPECKVGDKIRPAAVISEQSGQRFTANPRTDFNGTLISLRRAAAEPFTKTYLRQCFGAIVCDMETFAVASWANRLDIPLYSARVISDTSAEHLPRWIGLAARYLNSDRHWLLARLLARNAAQLPSLIKLAARMPNLRTRLDGLAREVLSEIEST